jgi:hypothetical protein
MPDNDEQFIARKVQTSLPLDLAEAISPLAVLDDAALCQAAGQT